MGELTDFLAGLLVPDGKLPLVHMSDMFKLMKVKSSGKLKTAATSDDGYPDEHLLYFFYGRPSYRVNPEIGSTRLSFFAPVCLIFAHDLIKDAFRIMPFDSGAFGTPLTEGIIHPEMELAEFELEVHPNAPMKLIKTFFGTELSYLNSSPLPHIPGIDDNQRTDKFYLEAYNHLVRYKSNQRTDDRLHAIEIQLNRDVELRGNICAVVLPDRWFDDTKIRESIEREWGAIAIPYDLPEEYNPREHMGQIFSKVRTFVVQNRMYDD